MRTTYKTIADLPSELPVLPITNALLLPGSELPLNITKQRYMGLVDHSLRTSRLIGIVQAFEPTHPRPPITNIPSDLARIGCAGRISGFQETDDDRYIIVLQGLCRFQTGSETTKQTRFRTIQAEWTPYASDLTAINDEENVDPTELAEALRDYLSRNGFQTNWPEISNTPVQTLINSISAECPFSKSEKQALLETRTLKERCATLVALLAMSGRTEPKKEYVQ